MFLLTIFNKNFAHKIMEELSVQKSKLTFILIRFINTYIYRERDFTTNFTRVYNTAKQQFKKIVWNNMYV